jgi:hypothetical protein
MAERNFNPNSPACGQWEMLLADSLDGLLKPEDEAVFNAHLVACPACSALFEEARRGREWLEFLSPEPEVPAGLLDKILAHTGPGHEAGYRLATAGGNVIPIRPVSVPAWQRPGLVARVQRFAEPRLLMTAAMAFFSIAMTLNITGVRLSSLRLSDLTPSSMRSIMERSSPWPPPPSSATTTTRGWPTKCSPPCGSCARPPALASRVKAKTIVRSSWTRRPDNQNRFPAAEASRQTLRNSLTLWLLALLFNHLSTILTF